MRRRLMLAAWLLAGGGAIAWLVGAYRAAEESRAAISDRDLGLRRTALADDRVPPVVAYTGESPGNNARIPRSYEGAPPLIPHNLEGMGPITREENFCVACHASGSIDPADPPQVPKSHLIDWRAAPGVLREQVAGARWSCTACHVRQSTVPALVQNTFGPSGRD